jgi:hypothetical protein
VKPEQTEVGDFPLKLPDRVRSEYACSGQKPDSQWMSVVCELIKLVIFGWQVKMSHVGHLPKATVRFEPQ